MCALFQQRTHTFVEAVVSYLAGESQHAVSVLLHHLQVSENVCAHLGCQSLGYTAESQANPLPLFVLCADVGWRIGDPYLPATDDRNALTQLLDLGEIM